MIVIEQEGGNMNISIITFVILATGVLSVIMIWISSYWSAKYEIIRATIFLIAAIGIFIIFLGLIWIAIINTKI